MPGPVSSDGGPAGGWVRTPRAGHYAWVAPGRTDRAQLSPMPTRLRDLIAEQARSDATVALPAPPNEAANDELLAAGMIERVSASIRSSAPFALLAQANHTQQSVRALLSSPQDV